MKWFTDRAMARLRQVSYHGALVKVAVSRNTRFSEKPVLLNFAPASDLMVVS